MVTARDERHEEREQPEHARDDDARSGLGRCDEHARTRSTERGKGIGVSPRRHMEVRRWLRSSRTTAIIVDAPVAKG